MRPTPLLIVQKQSRLLLRARDGNPKVVVLEADVQRGWRYRGAQYLGHLRLVQGLRLDALDCRGDDTVWKNLYGADGPTTMVT